MVMILFWVLVEAALITLIEAPAETWVLICFHTQRSIGAEYRKERFRIVLLDVTAGR